MFDREFRTFYNSMKIYRSQTAGGRSDAGSHSAIGCYDRSGRGRQLCPAMQLARGPSGPKHRRGPLNTRALDYCGLLCPSLPELGGKSRFAHWRPTADSRLDERRHLERRISGSYWNSQSGNRAACSVRVCHQQYHRGQAAHSE